MRMQVTNSRTRLVVRLLVTGFTCVLGSGAAQAITIVNGSFEQPAIGGSFQNFGTGSTGITGWTVTAGNVDLVHGSYYPASLGDQSIDLNGQEPGAIAQTLATTIGVPVTIRFDMGANPENPGPDIEISRILVSAAGESQVFELFIGGDESSPHWTRMSFTFTPIAATTTLEFASMITGEAGPTLDNVPEPGSLLLVATSVLGLVALGHRRTQR